MRICYHGTTAQSAKLILKQGFKPETFFALNLQDALNFGGNHIFEVVFEKVPNDNWQFFLLNWIKPDKIIGYSIYFRTEKYNNQKLRKKVFDLSLKESKEV